MSLFGNVNLRGGSQKEKNEDIEMKDGKDKKSFMKNNNEPLMENEAEDVGFWARTA